MGNEAGLGMDGLALGDEGGLGMDGLALGDEGAGGAETGGVDMFGDLHPARDKLNTIPDAVSKLETLIIASPLLMVSTVWDRHLQEYLPRRS